MRRCCYVGAMFRSDLKNHLYGNGGSDHAKYGRIRDFRLNRGTLMSLERHFRRRNKRCKHRSVRGLST